MEPHQHQIPHDDESCLLRAAVLMQQALDLLDVAGEVRAAVHLQHALDTLVTRLPRPSQPH